MSVISHINFGLQLLSSTISSNITEGLCKIGGFECLRHATSIDHFLSILKNGANPSIAINYATKQEEKKFFLLKDSTTSYGEKKFYPRYYAVDKGGSFGGKFAKYFIKNKSIITLAQNISAFIHFAFPPTVRFIYRESEIKNDQIFQQDQILELQKKNAYTPLDEASIKFWTHCGEIALETTEKLPTDRIGLIGVCRHIKFSDISSAIHKNPTRVLHGIAQLTIGGLLSYYGLRTLFLTHRFSLSMLLSIVF